MQRPQGGAAEDFVATEAEVEWTVGPTGQGEVQEAEGTQIGPLNHSVKAVFHSRLPDSHKGQCYPSLLGQHLLTYVLAINGLAQACLGLVPLHPSSPESIHYVKARQEFLLPLYTPRPSWSSPGSQKKV